MPFRIQKVCATALIIGLSMLISACQGLQQGPGAPPIPLDPRVTDINHIIIMAQENRSFDHYFGHLPDYWAANGYPSQKFDGIPKGASNPDANMTGSVGVYHLATECVENLSPSWNESHLNWNLKEPLSSTPELNGFVWNAANFAANENKKGATPPYSDTSGIRAMGYYDETDLNYYYFMASKFATSDRWFAPVMDRTQVNRLYMFAATSRGYAYPPGTTAVDNAPLQALTIFESLTTAGISWKVYYTDDSCTKASDGSDTPPSTGPCTFLTQFTTYAPPNDLPSNVVPISQYLSDVQAGTLPAVSFIETGYISNKDEHPNPLSNIQTGAAFAANLINRLMASPSWKDSVFILTYDESGGFYDHVPPQPTVNPDGMSPIDLQSGDVCTSGSGVNCNFNYTGYRVPLIVVSPFTKKNYVSHTVGDYTAMLKLIEARFQIPSLTKRDAAQMDMTEFFDFQNVPWATPPSPPPQSTSGACNAQVLR
jgi:phospholipase C